MDPNIKSLLAKLDPSNQRKYLQILESIQDLKYNRDNVFINKILKNAIKKFLKQNKDKKHIPLSILRKYLINFARVYSNKTDSNAVPIKLLSFFMDTKWMADEMLFWLCKEEMFLVLVHRKGAKTKSHYVVNPYYDLI